MKCVKRAMWIVLAGLSLVIMVSDGESANQKGTQIAQRVEAQTKPPPPATGIPVYKPPLRGAPGGRVGGGTRGNGHGLPSLSVLAPDHTGLTVDEQPSLFWFLSASTNYPIELTIIEAQSIHPLLEMRVSPPVPPGIQRVRLADYGLRLSPGVPYQWFVALVVDPDSRSKDIVAGGFIERVEVPERARTQLAQDDKARTPHIYAEAGLWYDAVTALSDLIDAAPKGLMLRKQRAALLDQVGLPEAAEHDRRYPAAE